MMKKKKVVAIISILLLLLIGGFKLCTAEYRRIICQGDLKALGTSLAVYSMDYEDKLPTPDKWCDLLIEKGLKTPESLICPNRKTRAAKASHYIMNKNVLAYESCIFPRDMVLVFEGPEGWNQVGGPEDLEAHHYGKYCTILFADGDTAYMTISEAKQLNWGEKK